jgi:hypothetical protein
MATTSRASRKRVEAAEIFQVLEESTDSVQAWIQILCCFFECNFIIIYFVLFCILILHTRLYIAENDVTKCVYKVSL